MHGERTLLRAIAVIGLELHFSFKKRVYVLLHLTRDFFYGVKRYCLRFLFLVLFSLTGI